MRIRRSIVLAACLLAGLLGDRRGRAESVVPPPTELPALLSLDQAMRLFRTRGLDLLLAEANVRTAEGQVRVAGAVPNPVVTGGWGKTFNYDPTGCDQCSTNYWTVGVSDSAAIENTITGKRRLRGDVARAALAAARMSRADAERTVGFQVKSAYLQAAQATLAIRFAQDVAESNAKTLQLMTVRFQSGAINEGDLARVQTQKLEADQALDQATSDLRQARVALAQLMGVRGAVPDFDVDTRVLDYVEPPGLADASEASLLRGALERRPDLLAAGYQSASARAQIAAAKRQVFPDVTLGATYSQLGTGASSTGGALSPPMLVFTLSAPVPVFYQQQGEVRVAEAQADTAALTHARTAAQVATDVASAYAAYTTSKRLVERMEGGLLKAAAIARDITRLQYEKGAASLTDLLDAQRTYVATNVEHFQDLAGYWTAVFQLEQAVGTELR
jgi:cobalt-zinc-cadmium efflux system outer membrane protein